MSSVPPVFVEFLASATGFFSTAGAVNKELDKLETKGAGMQAKASKAAGMIAASVGGAAVLAVAKGVDMAVTFERQLTRLQTAAGESASNLKMVGEGIKSIATNTGTTTDQLAAGMYMIESAGFHGAQGLQILKAAAQGAKIENADLGVTANALTSLMVDYHLKTAQAADTMSQLVAAVGHGKTTMQDLASALPNVAAAANTAHVSIAEMAAAIATMTMHGTDAAKAGTYLRQVIGQMEGPTAKARGAMKALGIDANQLGLTLSSGSGHGLADAITMLQNGITNHLTPSGLVAMEMFKKSTGSVTAYQQMLANLPPTMVTTFGALTEMTGGVKSMQGFLQLGGQNLQIYKDNTKAVAGATADASGNVKDWSVTSKTLAVQVDQLKERLKVTAMTIGQDLLPYVRSIVTWLGKHAAVVKDVVIGLVAFAAAYYTVTAAQWLFNAAMDANPVMLVVLAIAALAAGLIYAYDHSKTFRDIVDAIGRALKTVWRDVLEPVVNFFRVHWKAAIEIAVLVFAPFVALPVVIVKEWGKITAFFAGLWHDIVTFFKDAGQWLLDAGKTIINGLLKGIKDTVHLLWEWFVQLPIDVLKKIGDAAVWLYDVGKKILRGMLNGLKDFWDAEVRGWLNIGQKITDAIGDLSNLLWDIGKSIFEGLWGGMKAAWNDVTGWLSNVGGWISNLKGPIEYDRQLLVPHGQAIMAGLHEGLTTGFEQVKRTVSGMAGQIAGTTFGAPSVNLAGAGGAGGGQQVTNYNITVQGTIVDQQGFFAAVQTANLRNGARTSKTYQPFARR